MRARWNPPEVERRSAEVVIVPAAAAATTSPDRMAVAAGLLPHPSLPSSCARTWAGERDKRTVRQQMKNPATETWLNTAARAPGTPPSTMLGKYCSRCGPDPTLEWVQDKAQPLAGANPEVRQRANPFEHSPLPPPIPITTPTSPITHHRRPLPGGGQCSPGCL